MEFVSSLTASLAWPTGAVVLGYTMRHAVTDLLTRVRSLEAGGVKLSVAARAAEAVVNIEPPEPYPVIEHSDHGQIEADNESEPRPTVDENPASTPTEPFAVSPTIEPSPVLVNELSTDGPTVIISNWARTQYRLRAALAASGNLVKGPLTDQALFSHLTSKNLISPQTKKALEELRILKNDVSRGQVGANYVDGKAFESSTHLIVNEVAQYGGEKVALALAELSYLDTLSREDVVARLKKDFPLKKAA